jgi:tRNA A-37 threonylcarbamoyl transferase component Bud32
MYRVVRARGTGYAVDEFSPECLARLIDFPEIVLRMKSTEKVKAGRTALVVKGELPVGGRLIGVAFKRISRPRWVEALFGFFRTNGTLRRWLTGHEMLARGIPTARPLAVILPPLHSPGRASFFVTEWISDGVNLRHLCKRLDRRPRLASWSRVSPIAESVGSLIGRMHARNVSHRDLKLANLLVADRGTQVDAYLIDVDGAILQPQLSNRIRYRDLLRLVADSLRYSCISRTARLRFLKSYLEACGSGEQCWKETWRELEGGNGKAAHVRAEQRHRVRGAA